MLLDAPLADAYGYFGAKQAAWSADGRRLLITDTFLPLHDGEPEQQNDQTHPCLVAVLDAFSKTTDCVVSKVPGQYSTASYGPFHLAKVLWGGNDQGVSVVFRNTRDSKIEQYVMEENRWNLTNQLSTGPAVMFDKLAVEDPVISIKQSFDDDPPTLWATDTYHGRGIQIWDPNPQLSNMSFGKASLFRWTDSAEAHWTGGLVLPVGYLRGKRYPLVIQTHGLWDKMFMTDGVFPTAMAARPLASVGFVVLQIGIVDADQHTGTPREASDAVLGIEAAMDQLTSDGLIDPKRVGITGFSRTSWHVENALVRDPQRFAAAILADGIDEGYMQYLLFSDGKDTFRREFERINGGPPFAQALSTWMQSSASFHLDQVRTPIRIEAHGPESLLGEWQIYASLRLQQKPVDLLYFHGEQHILQNPSDRMVSQQGAVDWFRFWLQGYEDSDTAKHAQYRRWEHLREMKMPELK
jgi:dipeptidyl aminopeptidase/acylaminoacyl peptidase